MRSRRAWIYVLSVAALLVPAAGIAYLGAVSYRDERGAVAAQIERQHEAAVAVVARIDHAIDAALAAIDRTHGAPAASPAEPLARYRFWIDPDGEMRVPRPAPSRARPAAPGFDRGPACAGGLEKCVHELATRQERVAKLHAAERAEGCTGDCAGPLGDARRSYLQLASSDDVGPAALLGLARVAARQGDAHGEDAVLAELDHRFTARAIDGLPVPLLTAVLRARAAGAPALLAVAEDVVAGHYALDAIAQLGIVARLRAMLPDPLPAALASRRAALDARAQEIRIDARRAAGLADEVPALERTATADWRGRPAARTPGRTLIYKKRGDGSIIGFAADAAMLEAAAGHAPGDEVAPHVRALVLPVGASVGAGLRPLQGTEVALGEALPHLSLALVTPSSDPDPLDQVIRERSRRHVVYTSALAIALGLGLLATIRGAARARELARLKSDFVSTVSHELKTPLTSIRMFAEMLEQGVAQGDPAKMHRYHGVIVQESQRLGVLIANLLDYAQIERGTRRYATNRERVAQLARQAVATFDTLHEGRNAIAVEVSPEAMSAEALVDRDVIVQAVLNLLANAAKYGALGKAGDAPPAIEVAVGATSEVAWIAVRDHGPGIPPQEHERIFREFYRAPDAYRSGVEGTGLGLALVKQHVEALGGTVEVASQLGQGATFTIRLPRATEAA